MKRLLLAILTLGFCSANAVAQSFSIEHTTVTVNAVPNQSLVLHNILSTQAAAVGYTWEVTSNNLPHSWLNDDFGICDGSLCWGKTIVNAGPTTDTVKFSKSIDLKMQLKPDAAPAGTYFMNIKVKDFQGTVNQEIRYEINMGTTSVGNVGRNDDINIFPNPAKENLNVMFDERAGVKNIAVYNLIGKIVSIYKVSGNSAKLDLGDVPSGIYFVRLLNGQGQIVATRKFTHQ